MAAPARETWRTVLLLLPLPGLWILLAWLGVFAQLELWTLDLRFRLRGEIPEPEPIVYVNFDTRYANRYGVYPMDRANFAEAAKVALDHGAKAVFFDIVFSAQTSSTMVPTEVLRDRDIVMAQLLSDPHYGNRIIMAAAYPGPDRREYTGVGNQMPLQHRGTYEPARNGLPDAPVYPLWFRQSLELAPGVVQAEGWGRVALIATDPILSLDATPRWVPVMVETDHEGLARNFRFGRWLWEGPETHGFDDEDPNWLKLRRTEDGTEVARWERRQPFTFWTAALETIQAGEGYPPGLGARLTDDRAAVEMIDFAGEVRRRIPLYQGQMLEANWFRKWRDQSDRSVSLADVLSSSAALSMEDAEVAAEAAKGLRERFAGAYVLIGPTHPILQDLAPAPLERYPVPRVSVHGNLISTILSGRYLQRLGFGWEAGLIALLTACAAAPFLPGSPLGVRGKVGAGSMVLAYVAVAATVFGTHDLILPVLTPVGSAITIILVAASLSLLAAERQRGRIKGMFGSYLSPQLVDRMVESGEEPRLGGESAEITAFFSDVERFSAFSELLSPPQLVELMNDYLSPMTDILQAEGGTIDKYIGDAIVGIFGAPVALADHAARACRVAALMEREQHVLCERWRAQGDRWPDIVFRMRTRIGLNSGLATVGNMGSHRRFNYTMMGDTVNLAARSESGAKHYGVYIMVTGETRALAEAAGSDCLFRRLDRLLVMGRTQPVEMCELVGLKDDLDADLRVGIEIYEQALDAYRARRFEEALALLERSATRERHQPGRDKGIKTNPSLMLRGYCHQRMANPPPDDWDGTTVMTEK